MKKILLLLIFSTLLYSKEIINGDTLPPKPDPIANNATLGGVDSNNNGVRDDVERAIYKKYLKKLHRVLLIDEAKQLQQTMTKSLNYAKDIEKDLSRVTDCEIYIRRIDNEVKSDDFESISYLENITFNNPQRVKKYLDYNLALSGGNYASNPANWNRNACSPEVIEALEEMRK